MTLAAIINALAAAMAGQPTDLIGPFEIDLVLLAHTIANARMGDA